MIRMQLQIELTYLVDAFGADFVFNIHAARTPSQVVSAESLVLSQAVTPKIATDPSTRNRYMRLHALPGPLRLKYAATIDLSHHFAEPSQVPEVPVSELPPEVMGYIYPSRYCQSDQLGALANREFGSMWQGLSRVQAIQDWVQRNVKFTSNTSNANTSALDTIEQGTGVCRDFAHVMIALHAYVEVYLGDRWYVFDPSGTAIPMGLVRFGTGRDAADVAFATIFGGVQSEAPVIRAWAVEDAAKGWVTPVHTTQALSTDIGVSLAWAA